MCTIRIGPINVQKKQLSITSLVNVIFCIDSVILPCKDDAETNTVLIRKYNFVDMGFCAETLNDVESFFTVFYQVLHKKRHKKLGIGVTIQRFKS